MKKFLLLALIPFALNGCAVAAVVTGAEAAKTIAQERSVGSRVDDNAISVQINDKFIQKNFEGLFTDVSTEITEGRVLLTGSVKKAEYRYEAEKLTWEVPGVKEVINELQVTDGSTFTGYMTDAWLSRAVKTRLIFTKGISSSNYNVESVNGTVYLMGIAQNERELQSAIDVARTVKGTKEVVSHVLLKDDPRRGVWKEETKQ